MINKENIYKLYSFDIFDTLITRKTATPLGIFLLMQDKLKSYDIDKHVKNNFYYIRIETERYLRRYFCNPENEDITLSLIYDLIANNYNLSEKEKNALMDLEIELEYENSVPIYDNINLIEELVKNNNKVILISDMYLSTDVIRNMLLKHSNVFEKIKIYVSSELKKTKSTGNLYKLIKEKEQIEYTDWLHKGDNKYADIKMANPAKNRYRAARIAITAPPTMGNTWPSSQEGTAITRHKRNPFQDVLICSDISFVSFLTLPASAAAPQTAAARRPQIPCPRH